ncbi:S-adenosyl-L-methionine-dependent methyltransferase [Suillus clintonianus]|uniref:S-adenosyl-L-methionine-dependent methyltransferase n=1 Tax=Suillus clintonianus TaxID=1904413 RepID=UPI001B87B361|nr:S-adenosyl-L-methionine-dependent methyltransferase [Suillus clintonianus]KAG2112857.1 S-adenosyl-L-methionine-dependent methyltransferase [Suillus clintonianus]
MTINVHPYSQAGFATGTSEFYDQVRPSYPAECLSYIRGQVPESTAPLNIVEIGAGTGIFTRALLTHPDWATSIGTLKAIEPSDGMRDFWTKSVKDNRCTIINGTFDDTGVEDGWADLIIIAQAFHWCLDYGKAFTEFARILNKDGAAVFVWNLADREAAGWVAQVQHCIEARGNGSPRFRLDVLRQAFSTAEYTSLFRSQEEKQWAHHGVASEKTITDRAQSWSYITMLPPDEKAKVVDDIKCILERGDGRVWINKEQGMYQDPHMARAFISRKK